MFTTFSTRETMTSFKLKTMRFLFYSTLEFDRKNHFKFWKIWKIWSVNGNTAYNTLIVPKHSLAPHSPWRPITLVPFGNRGLKTRGHGSGAPYFLTVIFQQVVPEVGNQKLKAKTTENGENEKAVLARLYSTIRNNTVTRSACGVAGQQNFHGILIS